MSIASPARLGQSVSAPPRERPQRAARRTGPDWLPVIGWFVHDHAKRSRINVIPRGNTTDPGERFVVVLKFYRGGDDPIYTHISDAFSGDANFRYESADLISALGEKRFEGVVEITARSLDREPAHFPWVDSWLEFYTDDGLFSGSVPGFVFKGGTTKRVMSGKWQHWPGAVVDERYTTDVLLLNYHARVVEARFDLFAPNGHLAQSRVHEVKGHMPRTFALEECVPEARHLLRDGGFGSLRIWTAYKLPGFVLLRNRQSGQVSSFDHTVPFAGAPID